MGGFYLDKNSHWLQGSDGPDLIALGVHVTAGIDCGPDWDWIEWDSARVIALASGADLALTRYDNWGDDGPMKFNYQGAVGFASWAEMDVAFPDNSTFQFVGVPDDGSSGTVEFLAPPAGTIPHFTNFDAIQAIDTSLPFRFEWNSWTGAAGADSVIRWGIRPSSGGNDVVGGELDRGSTGVEIPANTLTPGVSYTVEVNFSSGVWHTGTQWDGNPVGWDFWHYRTQVEFITSIPEGGYGIVDSGFNPGASGGTPSGVETLALQPDGKVVAGGNFTSLGGQPRSRLGRLNADGSLDVAFNPGADDTVYALAVQSDGRILVGGRFNEIAGQARPKIARLNPDGSLDASFDAQAVGGYSVAAIALQPDGRILVGGSFTSLGGEPHVRLGRLYPDGRVDSSFTAAADDFVRALRRQPDGKIVVGGGFTSLNGQSRSCLGRLNADGSLAHCSTRPRTARFNAWRCRTMAESWLAASSTRWAVTRAMASAV